MIRRHLCSESVSRPFEKMELHHLFALHLEPELREISEGRGFRGPYGYHLVRLTPTAQCTQELLERYEGLLAALVSKDAQLGCAETRQLFFDLNVLFGASLSDPGENAREAWSRLEARRFQTMWQYMLKSIKRVGRARSNCVRTLRRLRLDCVRSTASTDSAADEHASLEIHSGSSSEGDVVPVDSECDQQSAGHVQVVDSDAESHCSTLKDYHHTDDEAAFGSGLAGDEDMCLPDEPSDIESEALSETHQAPAEAQRDNAEAQQPAPAEAQRDNAEAQQPAPEALCVWFPGRRPRVHAPEIVEWNPPLELCEKGPLEPIGGDAIDSAILEAVAVPMLDSKKHKEDRVEARKEKSKKSKSGKSKKPKAPVKKQTLKRPTVRSAASLNSQQGPPEEPVASSAWLCSRRLKKKQPVPLIPPPSKLAKSGSCSSERIHSINCDSRDERCAKRVRTCLEELLKNTPTS